MGDHFSTTNNAAIVENKECEELGRLTWLAYPHPFSSIGRGLISSFQDARQVHALNYRFSHKI